MKPEGLAGNRTMLDALIASLEAAAVYNRNDQIAPAAVLWTDRDRQWGTLLPKLRQSLKQILTLGTYNPKSFTGPAIWLRCMIARKLPEADWPENVIPILYLPGVGRQDLRAVEDCPKHLQPLAELQYRSVYWTHANARDWTLLAFLQSKEGGLGLDVARDEITLGAMKRALIKLSETPIAELQGKRLEASDFDALLAPDPARDLLVWLNDSVETRRRWDDSAWEAFRSICRSKFKFDPQTDGELIGAELLGRRQGAWKAVWDRFAEAPRRYSLLPELLRRARPNQEAGLFVKALNPSWPQDNDAMENELRQSLSALKESALAEAVKKIAELEAQHGERRNWVWAEIDRAPLAKALRKLAALAEIVKTPLTGATPQFMAQAYTEWGWRADEAVIDCLNCVKSSEDVVAIVAAIRAVYHQWLEAAALRFQELVDKSPLPNQKESSRGANVEEEKGTVILFADGLRFDAGQKLKAAAVAKVLKVEEDWNWVALPSVTATAKPAVSPISHLLHAEEEANEFRPLVTAVKKPLTPDRFKQIMEEHGYQMLAKSETGDPSGMGWTELGDLDSYGHKQGRKLAWRVDEVIGELADRIASLLSAGWKRVKVVTDHGWLLMPGGLPKYEMPSFLADERWGRCAALKETSVVNVPIVPWRWSQNVRVAVAPGIGAFKSGMEYAHGGLSLQECVAPEFIITRQRADEPKAAIASVEWFGLRCRVRIKGGAKGLSVDIRTRAADPSTSIAEPKGVVDDKPVPLFVENDDLLGTAAIVVLIAADGRVIAKQPTTVGG